MPHCRLTSFAVAAPAVPAGGPHTRPKPKAAQTLLSTVANGSSFPRQESYEEPMLDLTPKESVGPFPGLRPCCRRVWLNVISLGLLWGVRYTKFSWNSVVCESSASRVASLAVWLWFADPLPDLEVSVPNKTVKAIIQPQHISVDLSNPKR